MHVSHASHETLFLCNTLNSSTGQSPHYAQNAGIGQLKPQLDLKISPIRAYFHWPVVEWPLYRVTATRALWQRWRGKWVRSRPLGWPSCFCRGMLYCDSATTVHFFLQGVSNDACPDVTPCRPDRLCNMPCGKGRVRWARCRSSSGAGKRAVLLAPAFCLRCLLARVCRTRLR